MHDKSSQTQILQQQARLAVYMSVEQVYSRARLAYTSISFALIYSTLLLQLYGQEKECSWPHLQVLRRECVCISACAVKCISGTHKDNDMFSEVDSKGCVKQTLDLHANQRNDVA